MRLAISIFLALTFLASCTVSKKSVEKTVIENTDELSELKKLMTGQFASSKQAKLDSNFYDISLFMYPVWESKDGDWLYVEQSVTANLAKPYRQRLYKLEKGTNGDFISHVFAFEKPEEFIGKWNDPTFFDQFDTSILKERKGCAVHLKKVGENEYAGSTVEKNCKSTLRGASYATSKVTVNSSSIISWDQGFDAADQQVWGAEISGYIFDKKNEN